MPKQKPDTEKAPDALPAEITFDAFLRGLAPAGTRARSGDPLATDRHRTSAARLVDELRVAAGVEPVAKPSAWPDVIRELAGYNGGDWARVRQHKLAAVAALTPATKED